MRHVTHRSGRTAAVILAMVAALTQASGAAAAGATCGGLPATVVGSSGPDHLVGTDGPDVIAAGYGHDHIEGRGGNDRICAGPGYDDVNGGAGDDSVSGGPGNDLIRGDDYEFGNDALSGGPGDDRLQGRNGDDRLNGGADDDRLFGGAGTDDLFDRGGGNDYFDGGTAWDEADRWHPPTSAGIRVDLATRAARTADGQETLRSFSSIIGTRHDDVLLGDDDLNHLFGAGGDDYVNGRGGYDHVSGYLEWFTSPPSDPGTDTVVGGDGSDILILLDGRATGGPGQDTVAALADPDGTSEAGAVVDLRARTVVQGSKTVMLTGVEHAHGTPGDDRLLGDSGANSLYAEGGNDVLNGRGGSDEMWGGDGLDTCATDTEGDRTFDCEFEQARAQ